MASARTRAPRKSRLRATGRSTTAKTPQVPELQELVAYPSEETPSGGDSEAPPQRAISSGVPVCTQALEFAAGYATAAFAACMISPTRESRQPPSRRAQKVHKPTGTRPPVSTGPAAYRIPPRHPQLGVMHPQSGRHLERPAATRSMTRRHTSGRHATERAPAETGPSCRRARRERRQKS